MSAHIRVHALSVLGTLLALAMTPAAGLAAVVDCNAPNASIQKKITSGTKPLELIIRGVCTEHVTITRDGVTLKADAVAGGPSTAPTRPAVRSPSTAAAPS